jgi:hypothetical protein
VTGKDGSEAGRRSAGEQVAQWGRTNGVLEEQERAAGAKPGAAVLDAAGM